MYYLPLTLESPAENLALDEALLDAAEAGEIDSGVFRLWESQAPCVVLGRSSNVEVEVNLVACRQARVPVLRRSSGGGTILTGPGCLMYAVVLDFETYPQLQAIDVAHRFVLGQMASLLEPLVGGVQIAGISDLAIKQAASTMKFSGNAMRRRRSHMLYHGTLLYDFDLDRICRCLASPTRTPTYRDDRQHAQFVTNLPVTQTALMETLARGWQANNPLPAWPQQRTADLVQTKYQTNLKWVIYTPNT